MVKRRVPGRRSNWGAKLSDLILHDDVVDVGDNVSKRNKMEVEPDDRPASVDISSDVVRGVVQTEGSKVKDSRKVIATRLELGGNQPHVNCRVDSFGKLLANFDSVKKRWVAEMGFQSLFWLCGKGLPSQFCYWLMTMVDPVRKMFVFGNKEFPISRNQVRWVLGLPGGPNIVPSTVDENEAMKIVVAEFSQKYCVMSRRTRTKYIHREPLLQLLEEENLGPDMEVAFKEAFLAIALCDVLCPITSARLGTDLLPALTVATRAASFDWCNFLLDKLFGSCTNFAKRFYRDGYAMHCGGCTFFLAILYLDRLDHPLNRWAVVPRTRAWTKDEINKVMGEDRLSRRGDFGKFGILDVAYGEKHPLEGRDGDIDDASLGLDIGVLGQCDLKGVVGKARCRGPVDNSNPYLRRMAKRSKIKGDGTGACSVEDEGQVVSGCRGLANLADKGVKNSGKSKCKSKRKRKKSVDVNAAVEPEEFSKDQGYGFQYRREGGPAVVFEKYELKTTQESPFNEADGPSMVLYGLSKVIHPLFFK